MSNVGRLNHAIDPFRMRLTVALIIAISVVGLPAYGQSKGDLTSEYSKCLDGTGGVDHAMVECIGAETVRQDRKLNDMYKKLMRELSPERQKQLLEAQRLWLKYTEANCSFYYDPEGGTAARLSANECAMDANASRAKELDSLLSP